MEKTYPIKSIRQLNKQRKRSFVKTKTGSAVVVILLCISLVASAAILQYYAKIIMTVTIPQAITVDGQDYTINLTDVVPEESAGKKICFSHWIDSAASTNVNLLMEPDFNGDEPGVGVEPEGMHITYYDLKNYSTKMYDATQGEEPINLTAYIGWGPLKLNEIHDQSTASKTNFDIILPRDLAIGDTFELKIETYSGNTMFIRFNEIWTYEDDYGGPTSELPVWLGAPGVIGSNDVAVYVPNDVLGDNNGTDDDCGLPYEYVLAISLHTGEGPVVVTIPTSGVVERTIGVETNQILIGACEKGHVFCTCYSFDPLATGSYYVMTKVTVAP